jgi:hypothetical protein
MEVSLALSGGFCGRIDTIKPVAQIIRETVDDFFAMVQNLSTVYLH